MTNNNYRLLLAANLAAIALGLTACPSDPPRTDGGTPPSDTPTPPDDVPSTVDAPVVVTNDCAGYCSVVMASCPGANAQYETAADCMQYCMDSGWPAGTEGATSGNTIACRIYHGGVAGTAGMADTHCPHAGPSGGSVCGAAITFSTGAGTRVDRMGMPAVSTALVPSANKNAYNDGSPSDDMPGTFVPFLGAGLASLHTALDDDLIAAGFTPCSAAPIPPATLPECFAQEIAPGVPAAALVVPDTVNVDPSIPAGFPNGRQLDDAVIDPILAVILLRLGATCGAAPCGLATLAGTNPVSNDEAFSTTFPYLADAHTVP